MSVSVDVFTLSFTNRNLKILWDLDSSSEEAGENAAKELRLFLIQTRFNPVLGWVIQAIADRDQTNTPAALGFFSELADVLISY